MRALARIVGALACVLVVVVGVGLILPGRWEVERRATVDAPPAVVYRAISRIEGWPEWMAWPESGAEFRGPAYGPGASFRWDDPTYGSGRFVLVQSEPYRHVGYRVSVEEGSLRVRGTLTLEPRDGRTALRWSERGEVGRNPVLRYTALFLDERQGEQLEGAIRRLEAYVEGR